MYSVGPPYSALTEFKDIMKALWIWQNGRSNIDGLIGEEAPDEFTKLLFDVYDAPTLCEPGEAVVWSCRDEDRDRIMSVCGSDKPYSDASWLQYRVGKPGELELKYPENKVPHEGRFEKPMQRYGDELTFQNGDFLYSINQDGFTHFSSVSVMRNEDSVFYAECQATHPFLETSGQYVHGSEEGRDLHVLPKPFDEDVPTACSADQRALWSCSDLEEDRHDSVCLSQPEGKLALQIRTRRADDEWGSDIIPVDDERWEFDTSGDGSMIAFNDGREEYYMSADPETGEGGLDYWRGGLPLAYQDCTLTRLDEDMLASFASDVPDAGNAPLTYTSTPLMVVGTPVEAPEAYSKFIETIQGLEAEGAFKPGAGMTSRDSLNGLSPKAFVMASKTDDFRCEADFGGMCGGSDVANLQDETSFIFGFSDSYEWDAIDAFREISFELTSESEIDLEPLAFSFEALDPPGTPVVYNGEEFCEARADYADYDSAIEGVSAFVGLWYDQQTDDEAVFNWDTLMGVMSRYDVRAEPSVYADIIGSLSDEMAYFPNPDDVEVVGGKPWREVMLPNGDWGYVPVEQQHFLKIGNGEVVCGRIENDMVKLSSVSFGGD